MVVTRFVTSYNNDALYKAMADKQGTQMKQVKRNMNQIEKQRKQAWRIWRVTKKVKTSGLSQVATQENGQMRTYLNKLDIEPVYGKENQKRFRGAYDRCPFLEEPLLSDFGTLGINANADAVLHRTYSQPGSVPKWMTVYMNKLRMPLDVRRRGLISDRVKISEHQAYWKHAI